MVLSSLRGLRGRYSSGDARLGPRIRRCREVKSGRGQALVEFALILPFILLLILGVIDFTRAFFVLHLVNNASREGARVGILEGTAPAQVIDVVNSRLRVSGLDGPATINVSGVEGAGPGDLTSVQVGVSLQTMTGTLIPGWTGTVQLSQTTVMRHE